MFNEFKRSRNLEGIRETTYEVKKQQNNDCSIYSMLKTIKTLTPEQLEEQAMRNFLKNLKNSK